MVENSQFIEEETAKHTIRVFKKPTPRYPDGRVMIQIDDWVFQASDLKARILRALTKGPLNRRNYLEEVTGKKLEDITWKERGEITAAQRLTAFIISGIHFPHGRYDPPGVVYQIPAGVNVIIEKNVFSE